MNLQNVVMGGLVGGPAGAAGAAGTELVGDVVGMASKKIEEEMGKMMNSMNMAVNSGLNMNGDQPDKITL